MQPYRYHHPVWRPNPEPVTLALLGIGGVAALIAFLRARARAAEDDEVVPGPTDGQEEEEQPPPPPSGIGGSPLDQARLGTAGYPLTSNGVEQFQRDFNAVNDWVVANGEESLGSNRLAEDGKIGNRTSAALEAVDTAQFRYGKPWKQLVADVVPTAFEAQGLLQSYGYTTNAAGVEKFQNEFNAVNASLGSKLTDKALVADGVLGPRTRAATRLADVAQFTEGKTWAELVAAAPNA